MAARFTHAVETGPAPPAPAHPEPQHPIKTGHVGAALVAARAGFVQAVATGAAAPAAATLVVARPGRLHQFETGRDKPVPYRPGPASCMDARRDGRHPSPTAGPASCVNSRRKGVGAALVAARVGFVHAVKMGGDWPHPVPHGRRRG